MPPIVRIPIKKSYLAVAKTQKNNWQADCDILTHIKDDKEPHDPEQLFMNSTASLKRHSNW